ncbi:flagellar brake domain-containing protein [Rossellomorea aquimaris]|uniref:flagellar brake protein n=1 Tax=Rossellomorea aquimaris TaxID=189382 RepID=UPI001CD2C55B|nr:flagellar brake domain-containing protein [Rossellomorea aquimaris]MCA1054661.1 flagellar brake domain-containing protein [Rossellomorea aquimaris]
MIRPGITLQLEPIENETFEKYRCRVVELGTEGIYIDYPLHTKTGKTAFLIDGTQLKASFVYNEQTVLTFETEVLGRKLANIPMIHIHYPGEEGLVKIQRRQFVRVEAIADVSIYCNDRYHPTITEDISAGGCAVLLKEGMDINRGERLKVLLVLAMQSGECQYLELTGSLVRVWEKNNKRIGSIEFYDLAENQRQLIMRYCFERQLELRKKGLLE